jgi:hypothetical protein
MTHHIRSQSDLSLGMALLLAATLIPPVSAFNDLSRWLGIPKPPRRGW